MNHRDHAWPELPYEAWADTCTTLHLWMQIVGKVRLARSPWINHSWHATLYPTARGLTTSPIPHGRRSFQIDFDFIDHRLDVHTTDGGKEHLELRARSVADFHDALMGTLEGLGVGTEIHGSPNEVAEPVPFVDDTRHADYDPDPVNRFWRVLSSTARVFTDFRADFIGKCSPVHHFWGSNDLAVTRFSGRTAPPHPGGIPNLPDWVGREAYSHQVSSAGFWPGGESSPTPIYYAYAYPGPEGYAEATVRPSSAFWSDELSEFVLPYDAVREADDPEATLRAFLGSTYEAAAELADWDRDALEWGDEGRPRLRW